MVIGFFCIEILNGSSGYAEGSWRCDTVCAWQSMYNCHVKFSSHWTLRVNGNEGNGT